MSELVKNGAEAPSAPEKHRRIPLLDALRGLCIILMVAYHCGYDLVAGGFIPREVLYNDFLNTLQPIFAGIFITLAGISSKFSHNNLRRGLYVLAAAIATNIATAAVLPDPILSFKVAVGISPIPDGGISVPVVFGILHLMAACILLYALLEKLRVTLPAALLGAFLCFFFGIDRWPEFVGSADYFPLVPWIFLFFFGTAIGDPIRNGRLPRFFYEKDIPFLSIPGRHTLLIYIAHQPVLMGVMWLLGMIVGK